jgi:hypothetical protein
MFGPGRQGSELFCACDSGLNAASRAAIAKSFFMMFPLFVVDNSLPIIRQKNGFADS